MDFEFGELKCNFSNTFADEILQSAICNVLQIPYRQPEDADGHVLEDKVSGMARSFAVIAAHSRDVEGMGTWQPPKHIFVNDEMIMASADRFFSRVNEPLILAWLAALTEYLKALKPIIPPGEASTGNEDADFLAKQVAGSTSVT